MNDQSGKRPEPRGPQGDRRRKARQRGRDLDDIVMNEKFFQMLEEASEDKSSLQQLRGNPRAHCQGKGLGIPDQVSVEIADEPDLSINLSYPIESGVKNSVNIGSGKKEPKPDPQGQARSKELAAQVRSMVESDAYLDIIEEATTDEAVLEELKANPKAYLQSKGIDVPDDADMQVTHGSHVCFTVCSRHCFLWWCWTVCGTVCWYF